MTAVSVFNALLVSSAMIPAWLLCGRILKDERNRLAAAMLFALMPELWLSAACMAESLYIPMAMWGFWFFFRAFENGIPDGRTSAGLGLWICLLCLSGAGGTAMAGGAVILYLGAAGGTPAWKRLKGLACCAASFCVPLLVLRAALFGGAGGIFGVRAFLAVTESPQRLLFWMTAALCLALHFITSVWFFPVAVPAAGRAFLKPAERRLLLLASAYAAAAACTAAANISAGDGFGSLNMRIILRSFAPAAWIFLPLFAATLREQGETGEKRAFRHPAVRATLVFIALGLLFLRIPQAENFTDSPSLRFAGLFGQLPGGNIAAKAVPALLLLAGGILWMTEKRKALAVYTALLVAAAGTVGGIMTVRQARTEETPPAAEIREEAAELNRFLNGLDGKILMIRSGLTDETGRLIDTWCTADAYVAGEEELRRLAADMPEAGVIRLKEQNLFPDGSGIGAYCRAGTPGRIDYIVCTGETHRPGSGSAEEITLAGMTLAAVYRNRDPETLDVTGLYTVRPGESILFTRQDPGYQCFPNSGFSHPEEAFTWTEGGEATVRFAVETDGLAEPGLYWSWGKTIGNQRYAVYADGRLIAEGETDGETETVIPIPAETAGKEGMVSFRFVFPDARLPENGDSRILAVAFRELKLTEAGQAESRAGNHTTDGKEIPE